MRGHSRYCTRSRTAQQPGWRDDRADAHEQSSRHQMGVDGREDGTRQLVSFQQTAELEQRGGVRCRLTAQVYTYKTANRLAVIQRILYPFVGGPKALLRNVHAQDDPNGVVSRACSSLTG